MVQYITTPSGDEMAILPRAEFERLVALAEDAADHHAAEDVMARVRAGVEEVFPADVVNAILDGANPIKAIRENRGMTQRDLAAAAGINAVYLSQIERGARVGSLETLKALARALKVDMEMLTGSGE